MSDLTFAALRHASHLHMHQWAPDEATRLAGDWALPPARSGDNTQLPLPPQLLKMLARLPAAKIAPVLAEIILQLDRLAAAKNIDLGNAIRERLNQARGGIAPELPTELHQKNNSTSNKLMIASPWFLW